GGLEPERSAQDHRLRLLAARAAEAHGLDAGHLGGGAALPRGARSGAAHVRGAGRPAPVREARRSLRAAPGAATGAAPVRAKERRPLARPPQIRSLPPGMTARQTAVLPRRSTAKIRLMTASTRRMWTQAPMVDPDTRPRTQSTSRITVMVQSMPYLLCGKGRSRTAGRRACRQSRTGTGARQVGARRTRTPLPRPWESVGTSVCRAAQIAPHLDGG